MDYPKGVRPNGGKLQIRFTYKGTKYSKTLNLRASNKNHIAGAAKELERWKAAVKFGVRPEQGTAPTLVSMAQEYLEHADLADTTVKLYMDSLNHYFMDELGQWPIDQITAPMLRNIMRTTEWPGIKVKKNAATALRGVFSYAEDEEIITENPASKIHVKRHAAEAPRDRQAPYSIDQRDRILGWLHQSKPMAHAYFYTAFYTGMRTGELLAIRWSDYREGRFHVSRSRVIGRIKTTKTNEERDVLLLPAHCAVLDAVPRHIRTREIFVNQAGEPYMSGKHLNKHFREAHAATGVEHREGPYPWRHAYASHCLQARIEPAFVAWQLGHSLQMFFTTYASLVQDEERHRSELAKLSLLGGEEE